MNNNNKLKERKKEKHTDCDFGIVSKLDLNENNFESSGIENAVNIEAIENSNPNFIISCFI